LFLYLFLAFFSLFSFFFFIFFIYQKCFIPPLYRTGGNNPSLSISFGDMLSERNAHEAPQWATLLRRLSSKILLKLRLARRLNLRQLFSRPDFFERLAGAPNRAISIAGFARVTSIIHYSLFIVH